MDYRNEFSKFRFKNQVTDPNGTIWMEMVMSEMYNVNYTPHIIHKLHLNLISFCHSRKMTKP